MALVRASAFLVILSIAACLAAIAGCQPYRVEYAKRPAFFEKASTEKLPDQITLKDGTVIKYSVYGEQSTLGRKGDDQKKPFLIREEMPDGKIVLRAYLPEHVLVNALACLRNEEYDLLWEQLLCEQTRQKFEAEGGGKDACIEWCRKNRHELVAALTRMVAGLPAQETRFDPMGNGVIRCKLRPQFVGQLKFDTFDVISEGVALKLLSMG